MCVCVCVCVLSNTINKIITNLQICLKSLEILKCIFNMYVYILIIHTANLKQKVKINNKQKYAQ